MNIKLEMFHTLYIRNCCRSSDAVCYPLRSCYLRLFIWQYIGLHLLQIFFIFIYLFIRGTERHTETFRHCTKQKSFEIITKNQEKSPTRSLRIHLNGLFSSTAKRPTNQSCWVSLVTSRATMKNITSTRAEPALPTHFVNLDLFVK